MAHNGDPPVALHGPRIILRPHEPEDIDPLLEAVRESVDELSPWLPWCHADITRRELAAFVDASRAGWKDQSQYQFLISDARSQAVLGGISLAHVVKSNRLANMGYWVRTAATRRGIASEAARLVAEFAFNQLGLSRIEIAVIPANKASRKVAEKAGARLESMARCRLVMHGKAFDAALYSLIPADLVAGGDS